jgi:hypothetical protein
VKRGPCSRDSGKPYDVERMYGNSQVHFNNVKVGNLGTTIQFEADGVTLKTSESLRT